jgi:hypothetical protein
MPSNHRQSPTNPRLKLRLVPKNLPSLRQSLSRLPVSPVKPSRTPSRPLIVPPNPRSMLPTPPDSPLRPWHSLCKPLAAQVTR